MESLPLRKGNAMAAQGYTLGQVLLAGDWQSVAMLRYIKESEADAAECIRQDAENSDEEEEWLTEVHSIGR